MGSLLNSGRKHVSVKDDFFCVLFTGNFIFHLVKQFLVTSSNVAQLLFSSSNFYLICWLLFCVGFSQLLVCFLFLGGGRVVFLFTNLCQTLINSVMTEEKRKQNKYFQECKA